MTQGIMNKIKSGERSTLKRAKRMIESIVDNLVENESLLIGLTMIKDYDDYTYYHSVNVSILSMALGYKIGMDKKAIADLGMAALFHDMGKINVPEEILNKPTSFTDAEMEIMKQHPVWGLKSILNVKGFDINSIRSAIVAFEHHMHYNLTGYPSISNRNYKLDLFSRIVSIADQYDAMTSSRVYARTPTPLNKALSIMLSRTKTQLDPYLTKVFINMVGVYPIGSLVVLNTGEMSIVYKSNPNPALTERPKVLVVIDYAGNRVRREVDLMEKDQNNNFKNSIIKILDPYKYKINLSDYLLN
jgi:HD-GYP domain-containing protein (c-di-GMP phosphodiesterase class II)